MTCCCATKPAATHGPLQTSTRYVHMSVGCCERGVMPSPRHTTRDHTALLPSAANVTAPCSYAIGGRSVSALVGSNGSDGHAMRSPATSGGAMMRIIAAMVNTLTVRRMSEIERTTWVKRENRIVREVSDSARVDSA